jgi:dihydroorotase-like cyclic amidohydrolase
MRLGRGTLATGAPGDVTIFATDIAWKYDVNQSFSRSRNSPFDGRTSGRNGSGRGVGVAKGQGVIEHIEIAS